ncbi:SRPBCC domain-containing protein [Actinomadura decatromicini]|uniref:SRPBCC domain-containing protein n=1 Tax=Actinomadura decatromicini TaxID=2604572 RepID=UPI001FEA0D28|nr:SRPBCC domain-containing protein [Actinomadura decatromicini]
MGILVVALVVVAGSLYGWTRIHPHKLRAEIEVNASAARVWQVLTDFQAYPEWNPFILSAVGEPKKGAKLVNKLAGKDGGKTMTFKPTVLVADPGHELRWIGRFGVPGVVDGEHYFLIEETGPGRVKLTQGENFTGFLVPFVGSVIDVQDNFAAMNAALKKRAEAAY